MSALLTLPRLLKDEEYAAYFKRNTRVFPTASGQPWQVVALRRNKKWANGFRPDFISAYKTVKKLHQTGEYLDYSIIARNRIFVTPKVLADRLCNSVEDQEWCGRCRRPTVFEPNSYRHHALRHVPIDLPFDLRCFYCGISYDFHQQQFGGMK